MGGSGGSGGFDRPYAPPAPPPVQNVGGPEDRYGGLSSQYVVQSLSPGREPVLTY